MGDKSFDSQLAQAGLSTLARRVRNPSIGSSVVADNLTNSGCCLSSSIWWRFDVELTLSEEESSVIISCCRWFSDDSAMTDVVDALRSWYTVAQPAVCVCVLRHVYRWWKLLALRSEIVIIWSIPKLCALAAGDGQCYWMKSRDKLSWWSLNRHTEVLCKHQQIFLILLANKQKKTYSTFWLLLRMLVFWKKFFFEVLMGRLDCCYRSCSRTAASVGWPCLL